MPIYSITAPNGRTYEMPGPPGLTQRDLIAHVLSRDPDAAKAPPPPETGMGAAFKSGLENMISSGKAGIKGLYDPEGAAADALAAQQEQGRKYDAQIGSGRVADAYNDPKGGIFAAGKELIGQSGRAIAQSAPEMGGMMAGARLGAMAGSAFAPGIGTLIGGVGGGILGGLLPMTGRNLAAQQEATPGQISYGKAVAAGAGQAALEEVMPLALMGSRVASKMFGADVAALVRRLGPEAAEEVAKRSLMKTVARGGAEGILGEGSTEVLQQMLERAQAGKNLLDKDAMAEYGEAAYGGAIAGAPMGAGGHAWDRSGAKREVADTQAAADAAASAKAAADQEAAAQAQEQAKTALRARPDYATSVGEKYAAYEAQKKAMIARRSVLQKEGTDAGNVAAKQMGDRIGAFTQANQGLIDEFNATRDARDALQPAGEPGAAPEGELFAAPGGPDKSQRIHELQNQIMEHEQSLPHWKAQELQVIRRGDTDEIAQVGAELEQRQQDYKAAQKELNKLAPELKAKKLQEAADASLAQEAADLDPAEAQQRIDELSAQMAGIKKDSQVPQAREWAAEKAGLQKMLALRAKQEQQPSPYAEDLFGVDARVAGEHAAERDQLQGEWNTAADLHHIDKGLQANNAQQLAEHKAAFDADLAAEDEAQDRAASSQAMEQGFENAFAPTARSAIVDVASQGQEAAARQATEGEAITQRLTRMSDEDRGDNAKLLQAHGATVKAALYAGLKAARAARKPGDSPVRVESFIEAIKKIAAMEQATKGRAHYQPEFYDIAAPLVPEAVQGARRILGMSTPKPGTGTNGRGTALHKATLAREGARLEGVDDPALTAAMAADLEGGATLTKPEAGKRHRVAEGEGPRNEAPGEDVEGQGFLFKPDALAGPVDPRVALRQRIDKLRITPRLRAQARGMLERAADVLGPPSVETHVPQRVLENITEMVERAERGVGFSSTPTKQVPLKQAEQPTREVQGTGTLVGDEGELFPSTPTAKVSEGPTGEAGAAQRKALVSQAGYLGTEARAAVKAANTAAEKAKADPTNEARAYNAEATAAKAEAAVERARAAEEAARPPEQQGKRPVKLQKLEMEEVGAQPRDESVQPELPGMDELLNFKSRPIAYSAKEIKANPELWKRARAWVRRTGLKQFSLSHKAIALDPELRHFVKDYTHQRTGETTKAGPLYVGRATPANFQRALDTGALPSARGESSLQKRVDKLLTAGIGLHMDAAGLRERIADAAKALTRLRGIGQQVRAADPAHRKAAVEKLRIEQTRVTNIALKAADTAKEAARRAAEIAEAVTTAEEPGARAAHKKQVRAVARAMNEVKRQAARNEAINGMLRAFMDADAAPGLEQAAARHVALSTELSDVLTAIGKNTTELRAAQGMAQRAREKIGAAVAAPNVERTQPSKLPTRQPLSAHVPTEAEKVRTATNRSGSEYTALTGAQAALHEAKEKPVSALQIEGTLADAADAALEVPGVTQPALDAITARVSKYDTARAFTTRSGVVRNELLATEAAIEALERENRGGVLPPKLQARHRSATLSVPHLEQQLKATQGADKRAAVMDQIERVTSRIREFNEQRTPLAKDQRYRDLQKQQALLEFERDAIDARKEQVRIDEAAPAEAKVKVAKPRTKPGTVEPATKVDDGLPWTRMDVAAEVKAKSKFGYKARNYTPTTAATDAAKAAQGASIATEVKLADKRAAQERKQQAKDASAIPDWEGEGGRSLPKLVAEMYAETEQTPLSEQNVEHAQAGQLDKILDSLAKTASSPIARALATKLQALLGDTKLAINGKLPEHHAARFAGQANQIEIHPFGLTEENVLHEATHAATARLLSIPENQLTRDQRNARKEIEGLLKQLQKDPAFEREYGAVNKLELAAEVMSNPDLRAKIDAKKPGLWARFKAAVKQLLGIKQLSGSEKAMAAIERLFEPSRKFTDDEWAFAQHAMLGAKEIPSAARAAKPQTAMDRASALLTAEPERRGVMGFLKDSNAGLAFEQSVVDQRAGILKALSKGAQTAYQQAQYFVRKSDARMAHVYAVLQRGALQLKKDAKGNHIIEAGGSKSAKDVFEAVGKLPYATAEKKFAAAQNYMVAQRAARVGWDKLGFETGAEKRAALEQALAEVKADPALKAKLDAVRELYNDYNRGMVQFLADTGAIPKKTAQDLLKGGDYVPFYRVGPSGVAELVLGEGANVRIGDIRKQPYLQQLKGDEGKLMPLNEAIMRNTMLLTDKGLTNLTTKSIAYALQDMSKGPDGKSLNPIRSGNAPAGADVIKFNQEPDPGNPQDKGERWQRIVSEGTPFEGIPAEMLVQSLEGSHLVMTGMGKLMSGFGDVLRKGVTRTPAYLLRQLTRDPMSAAFTAGTARGPVAATFEAMREFVAESRGSTATSEALLRKGVAQSGVFTGDADDLAAFAKQLATGDQSALTRFINMADRAALRADTATRVQVYDDTLKATGSEMQAELAAIEMMNFTKRGSNPTVQQATRMIPFMNSQIQALNVLAKAFMGSAPSEQSLKIRQKFRDRALGLTAFSLIYAMGMEDNEEYKNATAQERFNNFFVPTPFGTFKIPIPYEVGLLFKALPEAMVRGAQGEFDSTDWAALRQATFNTIPGASSMGMPQIIKPAVEAAMNRSIFTGRDIETAEQQKLDPTQRYNENTTELAKELSNISGGALSPVKIEHLVRGYLGGLPIAAASLANEIMSGKDAPDRRGSQTPLMGGFIADEIGRGPVERAYAKSKAIEEAGATYDKLVKEGKFAAALQYRKDNENVLMSEQINANFTAAMKRFKDARAQVLGSNMSSADKRKNIDAIEKARNAGADMFTKAVKSVATAQ